MIATDVRVLVVDDEVDTCRNLSDILEEFGYGVDVAHDGRSALELVRRNAYDVALLDLKMPGMDGLTLYREIKTLRAETVALIVTAYAADETKQEALDAGASRVMSKPVDVGELLRSVGEAVDRPMVMVVDDDEALCAGLWDVLNAHGYRVGLAHDAQEAEQRLQSRSFDVLLVDLKLPAGDGASLVARIRERDAGARTVLITGDREEMEPTIRRALDGGADAVCYKPFDVDGLLRTIGELARRSRRDSAHG